MNNLHLRKPIGILGGTFDPIHLGHLHLATTFFDKLNLDELRFIPSYQPLLRKPPVANVVDRINMIKLAISDYPNFQIDTREIQRQGPSYTIDTLISLRADFGDTPLCLLIGIDQFLQFDQWRQWQKIPQFTHIVIANRLGYEFKLNAELKKLMATAQTLKPELLATRPSGYIFCQDINPLPISATEIRQRLHEGQDCSYLLPPKVWEYICQTHLYR